MKEILRELRNTHNYSQSAVASYLEISRQMYNKYETGSAEPSLKNIKKLCELYKVSADLFLNNLKSETLESTCYTYNQSSSSVMEVASPTIPYGESAEQINSKNLLDEILPLIPSLSLKGQITLMAHLASIIEKQFVQQNSPSLKTKKLKKIPDIEYNKYIDSPESKKIRESSLSTIKKSLKDDDW